MVKQDELYDTWFQILFGGCFWGIFQFTSENVCIPDLSANSMLVHLYVATNRLRHLNMSYYWHIKLFIEQTSENVSLYLFKYSALVSSPQISENVWDLAQAAPRPKPMCVV